MSAPSGIRLAVAGDAPALAALQLRAWQRAYADIVAPEVQAGWSLEEGEERFAALLEDPVAYRTDVFALGERIVGFVVTGPAEDAEPGTGELKAIYVDPPAQGAGVGSVLLDHAVESLRAAGFLRAQLHVFVENFWARGFYERRGWREVPDSTRDDPWAPELAYALEL